MIIDINCWLGHYPYRRLRHNTAAELVRLMDANGIDKAIVSSINAVFYKNAQSGNEELAEQVSGHRHRLIPFATINPTYAGWTRDLIMCQEEMGMVGLRAFPQYHGYALGDRVCSNLLDEAAERGLPVAFAQRLVDRRQHHWLDGAVDLDLTELAGLIAAHADNRFMVINSLGRAETWSCVADRHLIIGISRPTSLPISLSPPTASIPALIDALGPARLAFGTGMPFKIPEAALLKLQVLRASEAVLRPLCWENADRMLRRETHSVQRKRRSGSEPVERVPPEASFPE